MKLTNRKGHILILVIGAVALCAFLAVINMITTQADANKELAKPEVKTEEKTSEQSAETAEINALLKKAEEYAGRAEKEYKEAEDSWSVESTRRSTARRIQPAIYLTLKSIYTQNEVIIKLLREKVDK